MPDEVFCLKKSLFKLRVDENILFWKWILINFFYKE